MTSTAVAGAGLGLLLGSGLIVAIRGTPAMRPVRLVERIAPYIGDTPPPSRLLADPSVAAPFTVARRLFGPLLAEAVALVERFAGGTASVRRRLDGLGRRTTLDEFRLEQVVWGVAGMLLAALLTLAGTALRGGSNPLLVVLVGIGGLLAGVLGRDWWLSRWH